MIPGVTAQQLCQAGRQPPAAFRILLEDGSELQIERLLRVLPGKRVVGEALWQGQRVLAKLFVSADSARRAAREAQGIRALRAAGLPTPALLRESPLRDGGHVLLSEFLSAAHSLAEEWAGLQHLPVGHAGQRQCLQGVFALIGQLHGAGLIHEDLHLSNFLRQADRLYVIDGDAVVSTAGQPQRAFDNLALLMAQLPVAWDALQAELLAFYTASPPPAEVLAQAVLQARIRRMRKFLPKTVRDCTQFMVQHSSRQFTALLRTEADWLDALLQRPDALIDAGQKYKDGGTCTVARVEFAGRLLVIKRYNIKSAAHALSRAWRPSRAWHSWRAGHLLLHLGIATPLPLVLHEERFGPFRRRAFLVNEFCPGKSLLEHLAPDAIPGEAEARSLCALFDALRRMQLSHGDLKATNLLWQAGRVVLIDLDGVRQHRSLQRWQRAWQRDRARFLANWPSGSVLYRWLDAHLPAD